MGRGDHIAAGAASLLRRGVSRSLGRKRRVGLNPSDRIWRASLSLTGKEQLSFKVVPVATDQGEGFRVQLEGAYPGWLAPERPITYWFRDEAIHVGARLASLFGWRPQGELDSVPTRVPAHAVSEITGEPVGTPQEARRVTRAIATAEKLLVVPETFAGFRCPMRVATRSLGPCEYALGEGARISARRAHGRAGLELNTAHAIGFHLASLINLKGEVMGAYNAAIAESGLSERVGALLESDNEKERIGGLYLGDAQRVFAFNFEQ